MFISSLLKGDANLRMTFGLITYATIPMTIGAIFFLIIKLFFLSSGSTSVIYIIYYGQLIFVMWSLFILVIGNALINSFSVLRSFISSAALIIGLIMISLLSK